MRGNVEGGTVQKVVRCQFKEEIKKPKRKQVPHISFLPQGVNLLEEKNSGVIDFKKLIDTGKEADPLPRGAREVIGDKSPETWYGLTSQLTRASCAFTAQELLQGPPEPPYNGKFFIGDHHIEWDKLVTTKDRLCILSPRDSGKCLRKDHTIQKADGSRVKVQDWQGGELLAWEEKNKRYVTVYSPPVVENGVKPIFEITTVTGRVLGVTEEHPLLQYQGWVHAKDIQPGDRIAVMNGVPGLGKEELKDARLAGVETSCVIPERVFRARDEDIAEYLAGYFDTRVRLKSYAAFVTSTSRNLLIGIQSLLARLGIISTVRKKLKADFPGLFDTWGLAIGRYTIKEFYDKIPLSGCKRAQVGELVFKERNRQHFGGQSKDRFSSIIWDDLKQTVQWHARTHGVRPNSKSDPTRITVQRVAEQENNELLLRRLKEPLFWDEVVKVEIKPPEMTYAIQVPKYHTFIANDVINHNTYFFDFAYPIWKIIHNPGRVGFIFSATQPMAERILGDIKAELENNSKLTWLVPKKKDLWRASSIKCSNNFKLYAKGFGTKVRGAHPNFIIVDDGLTDETAYSELVRKKQIDYFYTAITNMIVPGGQIIVVGTPFAKEDLYGNLKKNPEYTFAKYQAVKNNKPLWPERYSLADLKKRKREIGSVRFSREFLCCKENTSIETNKGPVAIEDIKVGDQVLTHLNNWKAVTKVFERDYQGILIRIGSDLKITPNHPVFTKRGWVEATRLNEDDIITYLALKPKGQFKVLQSKVGKVKRTFYDGKVYNLEVEEDNSYFAEGIAVHNCNPIDDSSSFFPQRLFKGDPVEQYGIKLGMPREFWEDKGVTIFMGVDFAMSTSVQADYTVIWVMGKDSHGNRWIIDIKRAKGMSFQDQLSLINSIGHKYQPALIHLEANQMQRIFGDELIRTSDLPIRQFVTGIQKHSLTIGLPSMRILLENQKFRIPRGDKISILATDEWIEELSNFTFENDKLESVGAHDDMAMASWICNEAIRIGGFQFSFGPDEKQPDEQEGFQLAELLTPANPHDTKASGPGPSNNGNGNRKKGNGGVRSTARLASPKANLVGDEHSLPNVPTWY